MSNRQLFAAATFGQTAQSIDRDAGIIRGAAMNSIGTAKGHGVQLDASFVQDVMELGNEQGKAGLKIRFGHPTMCGSALLDAPFIGRAKNFFIDGDTVRGDIFLSNSAKETPAGDLFTRVMNLAEEDPDMFGMSIVFQPGDVYKLDEDGERVFSGDVGFADIAGEPFATIEKLYGVDVVDEGAATDGLFGRINAAEFAATATDFLDNNERMWELIEQNPDIVKQFMARYKARHERNNEVVEMLEDQTVETDVEVVDEVEETAIVEEATDEPTEELETAETVVELGEVTEVEQAGFKELYDAYGAAFAEHAFSEELSASEAKDAYLAHMQDRVADLEQQLDAAYEADIVGEDEPAGFAAVTSEKDAADAASDARAQELMKQGISAGAARFAASLNVN